MTELYLKDPNRQLDDFFLNKVIELEEKIKILENDIENLKNQNSNLNSDVARIHDTVFSEKVSENA